MGRSARDQVGHHLRIFGLKAAKRILKTGRARGRVDPVNAVDLVGPGSFVACGVQKPGADTGHLLGLMQQYLTL